MLLFICPLLILTIYYIYTCRAYLHYQPTKYNEILLSKCKLISKKFFWYTPYIFTGLLQAFCASIIQDVDPKLKFIREYVDFGNDYGYFALDWASYQGKITEKQATQTNGKPLVIVVSGLTASRKEPYISNFFSKFCQHKPDWRIVLYNDRLYNNRIYMDPNRQALPQKGYFHHVEDFRRVLYHIADNHQGSPIYVVAHSFGSNTLARYLGMCGSNNLDPRIRAAVCICNPFDFQIGIRFLEDGLSDNYIRKHRQRILGEKIAQFTPLPKHVNFDYHKVKLAKTSAEFDDLFTKRIFNSITVDLHYLSVNCINYIEFIKIPTFFLGSFDDPVINKSVYPLTSIMNNPNIISYMTQVGGHIAWFEGLIPQRWYYKPVIEYLEAVVNM